MGSELWHKEFPITSVSRADLVSAGLPAHVANALTDAQMERIAAKMADYYCYGEFWDHARNAAAYVVDRNGGTNG